MPISLDEYKDQFGRDFSSGDNYERQFGWGDRLGAAIDDAKAGLLGIGEALGNNRSIADARRLAQYNAAITRNASIRNTGAPARISDINSLGSLGKGALGLAIDSAPLLATTVAAGLVGGPALGLGTAGRLALGAAAGAPFNLGDILQNQREEAGTTDLPSALALTVPYTAAAMLGLDSAILGGKFAKSGVRALDEMRGAKGLLARGAVNTGINALAEGTGETLQEFANQAGRIAVNPNQTMFNPDANERYMESFLGGGLLGGAISAPFSMGRSEAWHEDQRGKALKAVEDQRRALEIEQREKVDLTGGGFLTSYGQDEGPAYRNPYAAQEQRVAEQRGMPVWGYTPTATHDLLTPSYPYGTDVVRSDQAGLMSGVMTMVNGQPVELTTDEVRNGSLPFVPLGRADVANMAAEDLDTGGSPQLGIDFESDGQSLRDLVRTGNSNAQSPMSGVPLVSMENRAGPLYGAAGTNPTAHDTTLSIAVQHASDLEQRAKATQAARINPILGLPANIPFGVPHEAYLVQERLLKSRAISQEKFRDNIARLRISVAPKDRGDLMAVGLNPDDKLHHKLYSDLNGHVENGYLTQEDAATAIARVKSGTPPGRVASEMQQKAAAAKAKQAVIDDAGIKEAAGTARPGTVEHLRTLAAAGRTVTELKQALAGEVRSAKEEAAAAKEANGKKPQPTAATPAAATPAAATPAATPAAATPAAATPAAATPAAAPTPAPVDTAAATPSPAPASTAATSSVPVQTGATVAATAGPEQPATAAPAPAPVTTRNQAVKAGGKLVDRLKTMGASAVTGGSVDFARLKAILEPLDPRMHHAVRLFLGVDKDGNRLDKPMTAQGAAETAGLTTPGKSYSEVNRIANTLGLTKDVRNRFVASNAQAMERGSGIKAEGDINGVDDRPAPSEVESELQSSEDPTEDEAAAAGLTISTGKKTLAGVGSASSGLITSQPWFKGLVDKPIEQWSNAELIRAAVSAANFFGGSDQQRAANDAITKLIQVEAEKRIARDPDFTKDLKRAYSKERNKNTTTITPDNGDVSDSVGRDSQDGADEGRTPAGFREVSGVGDGKQDGRENLERDEDRLATKPAKAPVVVTKKKRTVVAPQAETANADDIVLAVNGKSMNVKDGVVFSNNLKAQIDVLQKLIDCLKK